MLTATTLKIHPSIVTLGKYVKKKIREINNFLKYGSKNSVKDIVLPNANFKIVINPKHNGCVDTTIAVQGYWEKELTDHLATYIKPGSAFIDIGANIGYHSLFVASLLQGTGSVYSFEPIASLHKQIKESIVANNFTNLKTYQFGLGEEESSKEIYLRDENMGGSSLSKYSNLNIVKISSSEKIIIKTLDSLIPDSTKIDIIKIDVEGYELEALRGAYRLLKAQHPVIFMEFSPIFYEQDRPNKSLELIEFLSELGYSCKTLTGSPIDLVLWLNTTNNPSQIDIICTYKYE